MLWKRNGRISWRGLGEVDTTTDCQAKYSPMISPDGGRAGLGGDDAEAVAAAAARQARWRNNFARSDVLAPAMPIAANVDIELGKGAIGALRKMAEVCGCAVFRPRQQAATKVCALLRAIFSVLSRSFSRLLFLPHRRLPAAAHGAAMRSLARFMFIAITTN